MVFQKPNPFPSMTIAQNVLAGLRLSGTKVANRDALVQECLERAGLWRETRNRLNEGGRVALGRPAAAAVHRPGPGRAAPGAAHGRAVLGARPDLDRGDRGDHPGALQEVTIVIVTHNMQQAQRVSDQCALFLLDGEGEPGHIVEAGATSQRMFGDPHDPRTADYVNGRFG